MAQPTHPAKLREYCRRLHEANGWTAYRIRKGLAVRGVDPLPSEHAIRTWIDPEYLEIHSIRRRRPGKPGVPRKRLWQLRLERMRELREQVGLSSAATARLMSHDFGLSLSRHQVEAILNGECSARTQRRLLYPEGGPA